MTFPKDFLTSSLTRMLKAASMALAFGLAACGGSGGGNNAGGAGSGSGNGEVIIGLTDAQGDFGTYAVDVVSLTLTKANGAVVETVPVQTRVDFAQYTDMTEFLTAASVPSGAYVKGTLTLDYRNADIWVENSTGELRKIETIVDRDGTPLETLTASVRLEGRNRLVIAPGLPAHMTLDFDLKATNAVTYDDAGEPVSITVEPYLLADLEMTQPKIHRVRGPLQRVDTTQNTFTVVMRPFHHRLDGDADPRFGLLTVHTGDETVFEINGQSYTGSAGIEAMAQVTPLSAIIAIGDLRPRQHRFEAREVYVGSDVPGGTRDVVHGTIIKRTTDPDAPQTELLTVKGATLIRSGGSIVFNNEIIVRVDDQTIVKKQLTADPQTIAALSVGQRVQIFGELTGDSTSPLTLDATGAGKTPEETGRVHMRFTDLAGTRIPPTDGAATVLSLNLQSINGRRTEIFDFTGTGTPSDTTPNPNDADPAHYEVNTGTLDVTGIADGAPVWVRGFVTPWQSAAPDFDATTVVDLSRIRAVMAVSWDPASLTPFEQADADGLIINLTGTGAFHHVRRGTILTELDSTSTPVIQGDSSGGVYLIRDGAVTQLFLDFSSFVEELNTRIDGNTAVRSIRAAGRFDDAAQTLTARHIIVQM